MFFLGGQLKAKEYSFGGEWWMRYICSEGGFESSACNTLAQ